MFSLSHDFPWYVSHSTLSHSYWCAHIIASPPCLASRLCFSCLAYIPLFHSSVPRTLQLRLSHYGLQVSSSLVLSTCILTHIASLVFKYYSCVLWSLRLNITFPIPCNFCLVSRLWLHLAQSVRGAPTLDFGPSQLHLLQIQLRPRSVLLSSSWIHLGLLSTILCHLWIYLGLCGQHVTDR